MFLHVLNETTKPQLLSSNGVRDLLESEQHVPRRDRRDVDLAVALCLRDLQGEQQHLQDQV